MKKVFSLFFLITFCYLPGIVVESDTLATIFNYLDRSNGHKDTLIIFDIDNTLAQNEYLFGTTQWFYHRLKDEMAYGLTREQALAKIVPLFRDIQNQGDLYCIEENIPQIIRQLQNYGPIVIALTTRCLELSDRTAQQLCRCNIDFTSSAFFSDAQNNTILGPYTCRHGIVSCGGTDKGVVLHDLLHITNYFPTLVIFIDDTMKNIHTVEYAMQELGIEFIGIRYSRCDKKVAAYNSALAEQQLQQYFLATQ